MGLRVRVVNEERFKRERRNGIAKVSANTRGKAKNSRRGETRPPGTVSRAGSKT
jgi:hypothetical protein